MRITITIPDDLYKNLKIKSKKKNLSMSKIILNKLKENEDEELLNKIILIEEKQEIMIQKLMEIYG